MSAWAKSLGLNVRWGKQADAILAVSRRHGDRGGLAEVVALVYGNDQRRRRSDYGGPDAQGAAAFLSYVYHAPWGFTSQGALYAMICSRLHASSAADGGAKSARSRSRSAACASQNPNALISASASRSRTISPRTMSASRCICSTTA